MNKLTYNDYPFDQTPAWSMKLDWEFSSRFGGFALEYMIGKLTDAEFIEEVMSLREEHAEDYVKGMCEELS